MRRHDLLLTGLLVTLCVFAAAQIKTSTAPYSTPTSGRQMFQSYCASCHGREGKGDGPAASALKSPPGDLTELAKRNNGNFPVDRVNAVLNGRAELAAHGSEEMPVWGPVFLKLSNERTSLVQMRIGNLVTYLQSIQTK